MTETTAVNRTQFRDAMARLGAAVTIITTKGASGDTGFTASAVCSVTDDPPTILVCMNRNSRQHEIFMDAGVLCANFLSHAHEELSPLFAGMGDLPMPQRFARANWLRLETGAPVLENAAASLDCKIEQVVNVGTHSVMFCGVRAIYLGSAGSGLVYHGRKYHHIPAPTT